MFIYQIVVSGHECSYPSILGSHDEHSPERFAEIVQEAINAVKGPKIEFQKVMKARYFAQHVEDYTGVNDKKTLQYVTEMRDGEHELRYDQIHAEVLVELKDAWGFFDVTITAEIEKGEDEVIDKFKLV